jgi:hypothetical protein
VYIDTLPPCSPVSTASSTEQQESDSVRSVGSFVSFPKDIEIEEPFASGFYDFYDYGSDPLYESCDVTIVQSLAILFHWFSSFPGISKEAFSELLHTLHRHLLPQGNNLPDSYSKALTLIKPLLVPVTEYHSCINDCVIFRKTSKEDYSNLSVCPECNSDRYELNSGTAEKTFQYIPIGPRLKHMFSDATVSELLQSHLTSEEEEGMAGKEEMIEVSDLHRSEAWLASYSESGHFQGDPRGVALSLCVDGMNPFSKERVSYSMWPVTLSVLNLPFGIRNCPSSMILAGIIPGKSEPKDLNPYLDILVDEILDLNNSDCYDAYRKEHFKLKIDIFMTIADYPGMNKVFHCVGK